MTVSMLTPLFPPDTSDSAAYAKLLAAQLSELPLTVVAYGRLPESVPSVPIVSVDKSGSKLLTVLRCLLALQRLRPTTLLVHNGPSADVPALLYKLTHPRVRVIYIESDKQALVNKSYWLQQQLQNRSQAVVSLPEHSWAYLPAEVLPFAAPDLNATQAQATWWREHVSMITSYVH